MHSSDLKPQTNRHTRALLKSMLINYERHNGDLTKTLEIELVKLRILQTATNHYRQNLMAKAFCAIIKAVIQNNQLDDTRQRWDSQRTITSNTTLTRLLKGVVLSP